MKPNTLLAITAALGVALAAPAFAQGSGGSGGSGTSAGTGTSSTMKGSTTGSGVHSNGATNRGASGYAPGRNPSTANTHNPGRSDTLPPGQQMNNNSTNSTSKTVK
jgi:hypothetical protein